MTLPKSPAKPIQQVLELLESVRQGSNGYSALCPGHADTRNSLSVTETDDGRVLIFCHAGCDIRAILETLGLEFSDLFPRNEKERG